MTAPIKLLPAAREFLEAVAQVDTLVVVVAKNATNAVRLDTSLVPVPKEALVDTAVEDIKVVEDSVAVMEVVAASEAKIVTRAVAMVICRETVHKARSAITVSFAPIPLENGKLILSRRRSWPSKP